ncbi:MAG: hypothetical protein K2H95_00780, partial [Bacteroidales bacterium]|nr:hypothetical protein [Bacteroidales bacterium]
MNKVVLMTAAMIFVAVQQTFAADSSLSIKDIEPYSVRMIMSEMRRNPDATWLDGRKGQRKWNYTTGLELKAFLDASKRYELP